MAFSSACQCFFTLTLFFLVAASPLQTHARESKFFSKVLRSEPEPKPETLNPKTETISPSASPLPEEETKTGQGYGLFGKEEAYEYAPTTTNPTKSEPGKFKYVQPNGVKETNRGFHYEAGEKQGMSDTRFMENGKYFYDVGQGNGKLTEEDDGHESYYGHGYESGNQFRESRYETGEKQGMSDTRSSENGKYFYDLESEKKSNDGYSNNVEFYGTDKYGSENEKYRNQFQGTGEKQGMSDTRFLENGKYFYDIRGERKEDDNGAESYYQPEKTSYQEESYDSNYEQEDEISNAKQGKDEYDFRGNPNKFPRYEFDSMEEYEKYERERSHQKQYVP